jgi:hypothetical protein
VECLASKFFYLTFKGLGFQAEKSLLRIIIIPFLYLPLNINSKLNHFQMVHFSYISVKKLWRYFIAYTPNTEMEQVLETPASQSRFSHLRDDTKRTKVRISMNDLKVISSALLHLKKTLLNKKDFEKADIVSEVDDRIYQLIVELEKERAMTEKMNYHSKNVIA